MAEKKAVTALIELAATALVVWSQNPGSRADFYLKATRASMWAAEKFGRLAMVAELKYRKEVEH